MKDGKRKRTGRPRRKGKRGGIGERKGQKRWRWPGG